MKWFIALISAITLFAGTAAFAQTRSDSSLTSVAFWVDHWSRSPVILFGPEEEDFYKNLQVILFPYNDHDDPSNPNALDSSIQWLKDHPKVRFYVDGYASSRGDWLYNLRLSQRRADWVKQALVSRGIDESRIKVTAGWGELYPVCPESNDDCWSKNRLVRFVYSPD
jgi:peptidoglycan-associated lipoprotein